jgi:hypothetical protein
MNRSAWHVPEQATEAVKFRLVTPFAATREGCFQPREHRGRHTAKHAAGAYASRAMKRSVGKTARGGMPSTDLRFGCAGPPREAGQRRRVRNARTGPSGLTPSSLIESRSFLIEGTSFHTVTCNRSVRVCRPCRRRSPGRPRALLRVGPGQPDLLDRGPAAAPGHIST